MTDLVKGIVGGGWNLVVGWILPTFLALQVVAWLLVPAWTTEAARSYVESPLATRQALLLAVSAVVGLVLAAVKTPLYRLLEGYLLWPRWLVDRSTTRQRRRRDSHARSSDRALAAGSSLRYALLYERVQRYPADDAQFAPTALGNSIRRFEHYASDRYNLDSQLLWHHLATSAPDRLVKVQENASTNVDFFVCLVYGSGLTATCALATLVGPGRPGVLWWAVVLGLAGARIAYRLAIIATDEWDRAVRAMVDHGRLGAAKVFGLAVPKRLAEERDMWRAVNTLVRRPYAYSTSRDVPGKLDAFRVQHDPNSLTVVLETRPAPNP
ncbi:hypothetical protein SAMN05660359_02146 [Geodermatophilus obscurus]|uniref:Uncharacterized protein n=1 Tax=Geodermatophilus obscurus TaxID=1861 RepID=A0A1I5FKR9_9ACTN|nr:hypothetical protein [Geodermatophilus obscurus]SFO23881.1 hypothetical protein SAMN05660359_02146 [Geodermatophilus obscurus]